MFQDIGKKIGKFYFGVGGIGDLFLLLASYYDKYYDSYFKKRKIDEDISLVFWANNPSIIKQILKHIPNHKHVLVTENFLNKPQLALSYYEAIVNDPMFQGKGHIPDGLRYVDEWTNVNNVFDHYGIERCPQFVRALFYDESLHKIFVMQPYSYDDPNISYKGREIIKKNLLDICMSAPPGEQFGAVVGSSQELQWFRENSPLNKNSYHMIDDIIDAIKCAVSCDRAYGVDSWLKTVAGLAGVPTTYYTYLTDQKKIFPTIGYDPGDNIFIKNWGFTIVDQRSEVTNG